MKSNQLKLLKQTRIQINRCVCVCVLQIKGEKRETHCEMSVVFVLVPPIQVASLLLRSLYGVKLILSEYTVPATGARRKHRPGRL